MDSDPRSLSPWDDPEKTGLVHSTCLPDSTDMGQDIHGYGKEGVDGQLCTASRNG